MDIKKTFGTNKKKEEEGVWFKGPEGSEFKIARANNPAAEKLATELMRPYRKLARMGQMPKEVQEEITVTVMARAILLDWRGVKDDGKEVQYSFDEAKRKLTEAPDFADFIAGIASEAAGFRDEETKERQGN